MKVTLMNKKTDVIVLEYNENLMGFTDVVEKVNLQYAPLAAFTNGYHYKQSDNILLKNLNNWFKGRGIPAWRDDIESLLLNLNIQTPDELLDKSFGLSLSDQYWIKPYKSILVWDNINFFNDEFEYQSFANASFSSKKTTMKSFGPNNTLDGMLKKAWIIENGKRVLIKGGYKKSCQEPFNEYLASLICDALQIDSVRYEVGTFNSQIVSKCTDFVDENSEFIPACYICFSEKEQNDLSDYESYISLLEKHRVPNARKSVDDMIVLDYIMLNEDRHLRNFGVVRDVNTLEWKKTAPIFDTGESMQCQTLIENMSFKDAYGKFFSDTHKKHSEIIKYVRNLKRYNFENLRFVPELWGDKLMEYQKFSHMSDEIIKRLVNGIQKRILFIEKNYA